MGRVRAVPRLCELFPGICLTTEEKDGKTSVRVVILFLVGFLDIRFALFSSLYRFYEVKVEKKSRN